MQIKISSAELSPEDQVAIERSMQFALARLAERIDSITVVLREVNGPRGGVNTACRMTAYLASGEAITVSDRALELTSVATRNADRLACAVTRALTFRRRFKGKSASGDAENLKIGTK